MQLSATSLLIALVMLAHTTWAQQQQQLDIDSANSTLGPANLRMAFLTDCTPYSAWQSVAMAFAYRQHHQPAGAAITRIMCCTDEEKQHLTPELRDVLPTHVAKSFTWNEELKDYYQAYNKPGALYDWLGQTTPQEQYIMVVDSDMYVRRPLHPKLFNVSKGWAASADYTYLDGVKNELWKRHIPHMPARNDTLAGPRGRHADQVGGWLLIDRDDLKRVAPQWLTITKAVRADPEAWRLCGDNSVQKGERPWISEMYGYVYAAANNSVWHRWDTSVMRYPGYLTEGIPKIIHYGLKYDVGNWSYDKHWHFAFNVTQCAPWDLSDPKKIKAGIFNPPPRPSALPKAGILEHYRDLLAIETVATLNAGFCYFHLQRCAAHPQLLSVCREVLDLYNEIAAEIAQIEVQVECGNLNVDCEMWAKRGECSHFPTFMAQTCRKACGFCNSMEPVVDLVVQADHSKLPTQEMEEMLQALAAKLKAGGAPDVGGADATGALEPVPKGSPFLTKLPTAAATVEGVRGKVGPNVVVLKADGEQAQKKQQKQQQAAGVPAQARRMGNGGRAHGTVLKHQVIHLDQQAAESPAAAAAVVATDTIADGSGAKRSALASHRQPSTVAEADGGLDGLEGPSSYSQIMVCCVLVAAALGVVSRYTRWRPQSRHWHYN